MTVLELAEACAAEVLVQLARSDLREPRADVIARYVHGAITRALDEQTRSVSEVVHVHGQVGSVDVKVTKSTQGVALEVDVKRPREGRESWSDATDASALLAAVAYTRASDQLAKIGLVPGKEQRP